MQGRSTLPAISDHSIDFNLKEFFRNFEIIIKENSLESSQRFIEKINKIYNEIYIIHDPINLSTNIPNQRRPLIQYSEEKFYLRCALIAVLVMSRIHPSLNRANKVHLKNANRKEDIENEITILNFLLGKSYELYQKSISSFEALPGNCLANLEILPIPMNTSMDLSYRAATGDPFMINERFNKKVQEFYRAQQQEAVDTEKYFKSIAKDYEKIHLYQIEHVLKKNITRYGIHSSWNIHHRGRVGSIIESLKNSLKVPIGLIGMIHPSSYLSTSESLQSLPMPGYINDYSSAHYLLAVVAGRKKSEDIKRSVIEQIEEYNNECFIRVLTENHNSRNFVHCGLLDLSLVESEEKISKLSKIITLERRVLRPVPKQTGGTGAQRVSPYRCLLTHKLG